MASITAPNSAAPFNGLLMTDAAYAVSQSWSGVTPSFNFKNVTPWPTLNQTELYIYSTAPTGTSTSASYLTLQGAPDNATWTTLTVMGVPLQATVYGGTAYNTTITLPNNTPQYLRLSGSPASASSAPVGTFGMTLLF